MNKYLLAVLAALLIVPATFAAEPTLVEGIVVRVNDRILTTSDMRARIREQAAETGKPVPPSEYPQAIQDAADELCLLERAKELKIEVSDEEVDAAVKRLEEANRVTDEKTFEQMLKNTGITMAQLRQRLQQTLLIQHVLAQEVGDLPITEEELRQRYEKDKDQFMVPERVHLQHVIFQFGPDAEDKGEKMHEARLLVAAARSGGDFLKLVHEQVAAGQAAGGDLGTLNVGDLRKEIREVVEKLKPGEISEPFPTSAGVHVVKLVEHFASHAKPFKDVEEALRNSELAERYHNRLTGVVAKLKKRYVVVIHPEYFIGSTAH